MDTSTRDNIIWDVCDKISVSHVTCPVSNCCPRQAESWELYSLAALCKSVCHSINLSSYDFTPFLSPAIMSLQNTICLLCVTSLFFLSALLQSQIMAGIQGKWYFSWLENADNCIQFNCSAKPYKTCYCYNKISLPELNHLKPEIVLSFTSRQRVMSVGCFLGSNSEVGWLVDRSVATLLLSALLWLIFEMHAIYCFIGSSAATPRPDSDDSALSSTRGFMWNLESFSLLFPALHVLYHIKEDRYHHQGWKHLSTVTATSASLLFIALFTEIVKFYNWHK